MDWTLEVVVLPVSDIDRSIAFYRDQVGFTLDHNTRTEQMHVAQLTPNGSGCSIVIGNLPSQTDMAPGSMRGSSCAPWPPGRSCTPGACRQVRSASSSSATAAHSSGLATLTATRGLSNSSKSVPSSR